MKKLSSLIVIGFVLVIAAITNPTREKLITWEKDQMKSQSTNGLVSLGIDLLGGSILNSATTGQDYVFFTIFDTKITNANEIKIVGLFNHFIPLPNVFNSSSEDINNSQDTQVSNNNTSTTASASTVLNNSKTDATNAPTTIHPKNVVPVSEEPTIFDANNQPIKNVQLFHDGELDKLIPIQLNNGTGKLVFASDSQNGIKIQLMKGNDVANLKLENLKPNIVDNSGNLPKNSTLQVGTYDFNHDHVDEIIIAIGDNLMGQVWVYSVKNETETLKNNPFHLEMTDNYDSPIIIKGNNIVLQHGNNGAYDEYDWSESGFQHAHSGY